MGQQIFSNPFPRKLPAEAGPVPPILKSGSPIAGLEGNSNELADIAIQPKSKAIPAPNVRVGAGSKKMQTEKLKPADANIAMKDSAVRANQSTQWNQQSAELDKYRDDSEQLRQYLILVRGGEEE